MYSQVFNLLLLWAIGTPKINGWAIVLLWLLRVVILCVFFRYGAGPFLLRHTSSRIRVRSVSPRSVRGLYFRAGQQIWTIDRIGLAYHRPSTEGARRFSVQVEGLHVLIGKAEPKKSEAPFVRRRPSVLPALADFAPSPIALRFWSLFSRLYGMLDPSVRPVVRRLTVSGIRLVIRCLPALTQAVDFEIDSAVVSFEELAGAHVGIKGAKLYSEVKFTQLEKLTSTGEGMGSGAHATSKRFLKLNDWKNRFSSSIARTWDRAWGSAEGSASVHFKVHEISSSSHAFRPTSRRHVTRPSYSHSPSDAPSFGSRDAENDSVDEHTLFSLPKGLAFSTSLLFTPKRGVVKDHSVEASLKLSDVRINFDALLTVSTLLKERRPQPIVVLEIPPVVEEPKSPNLFAPLSPGLLSPMSPFMESFSASVKSSMAFRRSKPSARRPRLRPKEQKSRLLRYLKCIDFDITTLWIYQDGLTDKNLSSHKHIGVVRTIKTSLRLSDSESQEWREHLGGLRVNGDGPDSYQFHFTTEDCLLRRSGATSSPFSDLRILHLQGLALKALSIAWPLPPHKYDSHSGGDPNGRLLAVRFNVEKIVLTESVVFLSRFVDLLPRSSPPISMATPPKEKSPVLRMVPRVCVEIIIGEVSGRLICDIVDDEKKGDTVALTFDTDGLVFSLKTEFQSRNEMPSDAAPSLLPVQLVSELNAVLHPTFVRLLPWHNGDIQRRYSSIGGLGESVVSMTPVEFSGSGVTFGSVTHDSSYEVSLDESSTMVDTKCVIDAITVELWHPQVVAALTSVTCQFSSRAQGHTSTPPIQTTSEPHSWSHMGQWGIGRVEVIVTSRDLNPDEDLGISRGLALRTRAVGQFFHLHPRHIHRLQDQFTRARSRAKLYLPPELTMDASVISSKVSGTDGPQTSLRLSLWDMIVRSAVATPYAADATHQFDEEQDKLKKNEFFWVASCTVDANLHMGNRNSMLGTRSDGSYHLTVTLPQIRGDIAVSHLYSAILAVCAIQSMLPPKQPNGRPLALRSRRPQISLEVNVNTIQLLATLPLKQRVFLRLNALSVAMTPITSPQIKWAIMFLWVPSTEKENTWDELLRLREWAIALPRKGSTSPIPITAGGARLRIPHQFTLSSLILNLNATIKTLKHLLHVSSQGNFLPHSPPGPEDAKRVPRLDIRIRRLTLEMCDDPFEVKLGLIQRAGADAARVRREREEAFDAKVAAIVAKERGELPAKSNYSYKFSPEHSVSIADAWSRLGQVHAISWTNRHKAFKDEQTRLEETILRRLRGEHAFDGAADIPNIVKTNSIERIAPLLRFTMTGVSLNIGPPSFTMATLPQFLHDFGDGLPLDTRFWLLVPLHLIVSAKSAIVTLRDYPLPLLHIPEDPSRKDSMAWRLETDLVIAEEEGLPSHVDWVECIVVERDFGVPGAAALQFSIPKTTMPVKTYANADMTVLTSGPTDFSWGVSYHPAVQDVMRVIETITSPQKDPSPAPGFWDKMRLSLHWMLKISFKGEVHLHVKGSRDPYKVLGDGAGFALCWQGSPTLTVNHPNPDREFIQVLSEKMLVVIPNFKNIEQATISRLSLHSSKNSSAEPLRHLASRGLRKFQKVCARFTSGVRWGVGAMLERSCGPFCAKCPVGMTRSCRHFDFEPHYTVKLGPKDHIPVEKSVDDSFNGFRSDFIHMSVSLTSALDGVSSGASSNIYLSPKVFAHFWSWWGLFNGALSLPIRRGALFPDTRPPSKKLGRHLATLKYRIAVQNLFISHVYIDESKDSWSNGRTTCVGIKTLVKHFSADMHQREQEVDIPGLIPGTTKRIRHKPFYAAEVTLKDVDLRVMTAVFSESSGPHRSASAPLLGHLNVSTAWEDLGDFAETDWIPVDTTPEISFKSLALCPQFTYFKRRPLQTESTRFGSEDTHTCLLAKDHSIYEIQIALVNDRICELRDQLSTEGDHGHNPVKDGMETIPPGALRPMIQLLEDYVVRLAALEAKARADEEPLSPLGPSYYLPKDSISPDDWAEFSSVYQVHCPKLFMTNAVRDSLLRYWKCSRARRGFEYHMATRAVKYIRDQAKNVESRHQTASPHQDVKMPTAAHAAALALRRILTGDNDLDEDEKTDAPAHQEAFDPLSGWSDGVSLDKAHFCLLLKPQIVLQSEALGQSTTVLAAVQSTIQSFVIMDPENAEDPVNGRVMSRTYSSVSNLQVFAPEGTCRSADGCVPLEVLVDFRCQSNDFARLVPQTDATFHYDKFNRLRLRNSVTSIPQASSRSLDSLNRHLQHQTDLVDVNVPKFTVSAGEEHFEAISNVVTDLLLFSDEAGKVRANQLETLMFTFDFSDLESAAGVVSDLQTRLRQTVELESLTQLRSHETDARNREDLLKIKAQIFVLAEELNLIFDAIKLAQDKAIDAHNDQKSATRLHARSSEIQWLMLKPQARGLLAKLVVRAIDFTWLRRQDSSTVSHLSTADLQAFDTSSRATWTEIVSKYSEPSTHPLLKRGLFMEADWSVLAPVGGITVFEYFEMNLHPIRLQLDSRLGKKIMSYIWPSRRDHKLTAAITQEDLVDEHDSENDAQDERDSPASLTDLAVPTILRDRSFELVNKSADGDRLSVGPIRHLGGSRSFTDLRETSPNGDNSVMLHKTMSSEALKPVSENFREPLTRTKSIDRRKGRVDAVEMRTRSSQKSFIFVKVPSLHILLSLAKEGSFVCRDARIETHDLMFRNRTLSFHELVGQFMPADHGWKGWVKMALQQPLVDVTPLAFELWRKTKFIRGKRGVDEGEASSDEELVSRSDPKAGISRSQSSTSRTQTPPPQTSINSQRRWPHVFRKNSAASTSKLSLPVQDTK